MHRSLRTWASTAMPSKPVTVKQDVKSALETADSLTGPTVPEVLPSQHATSTWINSEQQISLKMPTISFPQTRQGKSFRVGIDQNVLMQQSYKIIHFFHQVITLLRYCCKIWVICMNGSLWMYVNKQIASWQQLDLHLHIKRKFLRTDRI